MRLSESCAGRTLVAAPIDRPKLARPTFRANPVVPVNPPSGPCFVCCHAAPQIAAQVAAQVAAPSYRCWLSSFDISSRSIIYPPCTPCSLPYISPPRRSYRRLFARHVSPFSHLPLRSSESDPALINGGA